MSIYTLIDGTSTSKGPGANLVEQFFRGEKAPQTVQEQENQLALMRITLAFMYEPLRLYREVTKKVSQLRIPELDAFVNAKPKYEALKDLRKAVFHVPLDHIDLDSRSAQFMPLSNSILTLLEPIMNFYYECPDPR